MKRPAIHLKAANLSPCRSAEPVSIKVWQNHFWHKAFIKFLPLKSHPNRFEECHMAINRKSPHFGKQLLRYSLRALALGVFGWSLAAPGAVTNVNIVNFAFSPNNVRINVNDSVVWNWVGSPHSTTSDTGLWDSGVFGAGHTFTRTFTSAGSFPFLCTVHPFMTGNITVQPVDLPPTAAFTAPLNGSVFAAPASFNLAATAADADGSITNVEFLQSGSLVGNATTSPYSIAIRNLASGTYTFSVVASDNSGSRATNALTISVITPAPIALSAAQRLSPTSFQFSYSATIGLRYVVQRSTDLSHWVDLSTNTATASPIVFRDTGASADPAFYRVGLLPNP